MTTQIPRMTGKYSYEEASHPLFTNHKPTTGDVLDTFDALAEFHQREERRRAWRHTAGLDGNGHGAVIPEIEDKV